MQDNPEALRDLLVEQVDRDAVTAFAQEPHVVHYLTNTKLEGGWKTALAQAFARHRLSTLTESAEVSEPVVIDLDAEAFKSFCKAAGESNWIPPGYFANDWIADCCNFLRTGEGISHPQPSVSSETQSEMFKRLALAADRAVGGRVEKLEEALRDIAYQAETRIKDGDEMGARVWRIALVDILSEARTALSKEGGRG